MDGRFVREDITKSEYLITFYLKILKIYDKINISFYINNYIIDHVINPNLRAEKELLQLRANRFISQTEAHRMEFLKSYDFEKNSKLKIEFSANLTDPFYFENYINENNVIYFT